MMKKRSISIAAFAITALALTACSGGGSADGEAGAESYSLKLASYQPPGAAEAMATVSWAEQVNEATDGQVEIEYMFQEALLPGAETLQGVGDGRADMGYIADAYYPGELPLTNIAGVPFVTSSAEAQGKAFAELYETNDAFRAEWENQGVHVLYWAPVPPNTVALKDPAQNLDDLDGRKVRQIGFSAEAFEQAGITPVAIGHSEVYEALQRGVVDGVSGGSFDILTDRDYQEIAPNFMDLRSGNYATTAVIINKKLWDSFPADVQETMTALSADYLDMYMDVLMQHEDDACTKLLDAGGTITILDQAEADAWADEVGPSIKSAWERNVDNSGSGADAAAFFDEYTAAITKYEAESTYEPALQRCDAR
jgi:TRAP-type C4-dicarboxylate transport system substrate-binding protein